jgi:hypothetical protein
MPILEAQQQQQPWQVQDGGLKWYYILSFPRDKFGLTLMTHQEAECALGSMVIGCIGHWSQPLKPRET